MSSQILISVQLCTPAQGCITLCFDFKQVNVATVNVATVNVATVNVATVNIATVNVVQFTYKFVGAVNMTVPCVVIHNMSMQGVD